VGEEEEDEAPTTKRWEGVWGKKTKMLVGQIQSTR
jgi:hypothetical protein